MRSELTGGAEHPGMRPSRGELARADGAGFPAEGTGQQDSEQSLLWSDLLGVGVEAERQSG